MWYRTERQGNARPTLAQWAGRTKLAIAPLICLPGCATLGSMMSPYSETFSCKNDDHGQCIHPARAYEDAVAGAVSKSDPGVTNDKGLLGASASAKAGRQAPGRNGYGSYRDSVYRELKGLIDAPVTPMLKPARTVRTLILPYADRQHGDRLYMARYIYSVVDRPVWVMGGALVAAPQPSDATKILDQVRETVPTDEAGTPAQAPSNGHVKP